MIVHHLHCRNSKAIKKVLLEDGTMALTCEDCYAYEIVPMPDIVERLRDVGKITAGHAIEDLIDPIAHAAIDEIMELRARIKRLEIAASWANYS